MGDHQLGGGGWRRGCGRRSSQPQSQTGQQGGKRVVATGHDQSPEQGFNRAAAEKSRIEPFRALYELTLLNGA
jgi:hypothetical protein